MCSNPDTGFLIERDKFQQPAMFVSGIVVAYKLHFIAGGSDDIFVSHPFIRAVVAGNIYLYQPEALFCSAQDIALFKRFRAEMQETEGAVLFVFFQCEIDPVFIKIPSHAIHPPYGFGYGFRKTK